MQQPGVVLVEPQERGLQRLRTPHDDAEPGCELRGRLRARACSAGTRRISGRSGDYAVLVSTKHRPQEVCPRIIEI